MRTKTFLGSVALGIAGLALAAPMANAAAKGSIGLDKDVVHQGDSVQIFGTCDAPVKGVKVHSEVLEPVSLYRKEDGTGKQQLSGHTKVKANAHRGAWEVYFDCAGTRVQTLIVVQEQEKPTTPTKPTTPKPKAQVAVKPKGAADTGAGDIAAESDSDIGLYVLGGAGLLAAGGAGAFFLRRRARA